MSVLDHRRTLPSFGFNDVGEARGKRVYDVWDSRVHPPDYNKERVRWLAILEVARQEEEYSHYTFIFCFYHSIFERGEVADDKDTMIAEAKEWVEEYFRTHPKPLPRLRWGKPIYVDYK